MLRSMSLVNPDSSFLMLKEGFALVQAVNLSLIQQGLIKLVKYNGTNVYIVIKNIFQISAVLWNFIFMEEFWKIGSQFPSEI